jgi:TonB-linked SusC/RagA family outer membrane protein
LIQGSAFSQSLASIVTSQQKSSSIYQNGANKRLLSEVLKETESRFSVFFTYKNKTLEGKMVDLNGDELWETSKLGKDFDVLLTELLTSHKLRFKKIDNIYFIYAEDERVKENSLERKSNKWLNSTKEPEELLDNNKYYISNLEQLRAMRLAMAVTVSGKVTGENDDPLPGVNVTVKNTTTGTVTDAGGNYTLTVPNESAVLVFSYIGYTTEEVPVGTRTSIDMKLVPDIKSLSEVVVVGYGTQQRRDVTGAIASVNANDIKALPLTSLDQALQGRAAGVQVTQNSGAPGGSVSVRIRGVGSINGSEPLYVIDGFPTQGGLNSINPNDIESIEILKDAGASAIYGSRASNGVVLVTTKRGRAGKAKIEFDSYYGVQGPWKKIDVLNGPDFATLANEAFTNSNTDPRRANENQEPLNPLWANPSSLPTYDWQDAIFQNAPIQNYNLSISGGTEKLRSAVTASYFRQEGLIVNSHYQRFTFRANNDFEVTQKLKFGNSFTIARENSRSVPTDRDYDGILQTAYQMHPMQPIHAADGLQSETLFGLDGYAHFPLTTAARYYPRQLYNPIWGTAIRKNNNINLRLLGTFLASMKLLMDYVYAVLSEQT